MTPLTSPITSPGGGPTPAPGWLDRGPVIALVCLAAILPLLVVDFPPLTDLYGHLGRYAVQTELAQRPALQPFFSYEWKLIGNLGGDIVVQLLHPLLGLEASVRAAVILAQLLGAFGLLLVSREVHGRVTPFAVAAIPMLYGYPFNYGFLNYALSMALALLAYIVWLRLHRQDRSLAARLWLAVAGAAIWVAHTYGWAFLGLLTGSTMLAQVFAERDRVLPAIGRILGACWPLLLPVIPMVIWRAESSGAAMSGWSLLYKWVFLLSPLRTKWEIFDIGSALVVLLMLVWALFSRTVRYDRGLAITALLCLFFFAALPVKVFGSAFADMRLLPYGMGIGLVAIGPVRARSRVLAAAGAVALAFFAVRMTATGWAYVEQARSAEAALPAVDQMPRGARVAFFAVKPCRVAWALAPLDHLAGAATARRDAFVNDQWQQPGVNPLKVHYPAAEPFTRDPSHLVQGDRCGHRARRPLSEALAMLPRAAFTHVWMVGAIPRDFVPPPGLVEVPGSGSGRLFRIVPEG
ncbi:hypothetical protein ACLBKU_03045 [Erythrobacter sp. NE805]|uniref:hypothetical protein n=1 Tax=Erythrobacter sp. NE805 TaxID=3389875 RepID=UPI00396B0BAC